MSNSILTEKQRKFITSFAKDRVLSEKFYLTGGTALCEFYIPYRHSDDLDFFSENEFDLTAITAFLKKQKKYLGYNKFDFNTSFNRNIFQIIFENEVLKTEFTYFPFPQIQGPKEKMGVKIDSVEDIATNKLFTIYQKPRARDYTDLYKIIDKYDFNIRGLIKKAKAKFDWHVDPVKLGSQFLKAKELKDYPRLIEKMDHKSWQKFFENEAKKLQKDILHK